MKNNTELEMLLMQDASTMLIEEELNHLRRLSKLEIYLNPTAFNLLKDRFEVENQNSNSYRLPYYFENNGITVYFEIHMVYENTPDLQNLDSISTDVIDFLKSQLKNVNEEINTLKIDLSTKEVIKASLTNTINTLEEELQKTLLNENSRILGYGS